MTTDEQNFKLIVLSEAGREFILNEDPKKLLDNVFNRLSVHLDLDVYFNYIFDEETQRLHLMNYHGIGPGEHVPIEWLSLDDSVCGEAATRRSRILIEDVQRSSDPRAWLIKGFGLKSYVSHPLISYGKFVGTLSFGSRKRLFFSDLELDILQTVCSQASIVLDRVLLISELKRKNRELAQKNKELKHSEEQLATIFSVIPSPVLVLSLETQQIIACNDALLALLDISREELFNRYWPERQRPDSLIKPILDASMKALHKSHMEVSFSDASGQMKICLCNAVSVDINQTPGMLAVFSDLTEHKEYEKELVRLDQLHLIGEMAAGIGHEVRNPLTTVRGFLQLMRKTAVEKSPYLDVMIEELDRANSIISEFLGLAKNQRIDMKSNGLNALIEKILPLIQADATVAGKTVTAELGPVPLMLMDEKLIRQLILNMVRNGLEAMPPEGYLTIRTYTEDDSIVLSVEDNGKGIPSDQIEHIWKPFFTTKESGSGLGLAVCFNVADKHGAKIDVVTGPAGTTFTVKFKRLPA